MADAGGTAVAKKNTPPQLDKAEVLDLVNDSLGFLDRLFTEQGLGVLEANTDTNGVRDFLGEQWETSRIGKWLQYTDSLAQHVGALVRAKRALAYHAGQPDQNRHFFRAGDFRLVLRLKPQFMDLVQQEMRDSSTVSLISKSLITLNGETSDLLITPFTGRDQEDVDRMLRPVVQVVKDKHWEDDGLGDEGDDNDDDEPGHTDEEITARLAFIMDTFVDWVDEHGFDRDLWPQWVNRMSEEVFNGVPFVEFEDENQKQQWGLHKIMHLAECLNKMVIGGGRVTTRLRGQLDGARKRAKAAKNRSAILEAQLKECNAARSQQGQRTGQTTQQTSNESELAGQVRDLRRQLDAEKKKHAETKQKYKAASARAGNGNGDASGEEGDGNDEPSCQEKLDAVCARLEQERKQMKQVVELQDKTRKRAKQAEEARKKLERSLAKEIQKNAKLDAKLKASGGTTTDDSSATADAAALAADLAKAKKDKDDLEKRAKKAEAELAEAQNAASTQADSGNIKKLRQDRAGFKARYEAAESTLGDALTKEKNATQAAAIAKDKIEKAEKAEKDAKAKAAQDAKALQDCQKALAAAKKKTTGGDNPADEDTSDDEGGVLSQGTFYLTRPRQSGATNNGTLRVVLKSDLIPVNDGASDGWVKKLADAHAEGTAKIVKNANGVSVLKVKARFEPKEGDKQRTEEQDAGDKPGDDGKGGKRKAGKGTEEAGQTGKKQKTGATTRATKATRGRGGGAAARGGRSGKGKQKATDTDDEENNDEDEDGGEGDD